MFYLCSISPSPSLLRVMIATMDMVLFSSRWTSHCVHHQITFRSEFSDLYIWEVNDDYLACCTEVVAIPLSESFLHQDWSPESEIFPRTTGLIPNTTDGLANSWVMTMRSLTRRVRTILWWMLFPAHWWPCFSFSYFYAYSNLVTICSTRLCEWIFLIWNNPIVGQ